MKGDFSRGHRPDAKRGQAYRRVLLQQGRVLLDSDIAAMADAEEAKLREAVRFSACRAGSPDLGFLVTPGALLALFDTNHGVSFAAQGGAQAVRDYSHKYLGRLPGLRISGAAGTVTVALRGPALANTAIRIWARAEAAVAATVNGIAINVAGPAYAPVGVTVSGSQLQFAVNPARAYWIALVETAAAPGADLTVGTAAGNYEIDGLIAWSQGGPQACVPAPVPPPATNDRFVAYLEIHERHIAAVEDRGILEEALGGEHDTTTRTRVRAQVKLARLEALDAAAAAAAVLKPVLPSGQVKLGTVSATPAADPCDLPAPGGYTGPENRLYILEVHASPPVGETVFKWSRDNGAELFPVSYGPGLISAVDRLSAASHLDLRDGDLVELASEASDLGDEASGFIDASASTGRGVRKVCCCGSQAGSRRWVRRGSSLSAIPSPKWSSLPSTQRGSARLASSSGAGPACCAIPGRERSRWCSNMASSLR